MLLDQKSESYYSYLLRVWQVNSQPPRWQLSLSDARTGETFNFSDMQQLKNFLDQLITASSPLE